MMKIDWKKFSNSPGYKSLKSRVLKDTEGKSCFNVTGCKERDCKCFHEYCNKFKYVIDKVKKISYKYNIEPEEILNKWEEHRTCWYANFYQNCNLTRLLSLLDIKS